MTKLLLLGAQHGNELLGKQLFDHIVHKQPQLLPYVTYKTGNIKAYKQNVRYIESDLNRSYTGSTKTYEARRATRILQYIAQRQFDIVLDLHTTTCEQPPCFIVPGIRSEIKGFLKASSISKIVQMNHSIVSGSLIGKCPQAISIEINRREAAKSNILDSLCDDIEGYLINKTSTDPKTIYYVDDLLMKNELSDKEASELHNFVYDSHGYYPILVGENSYKKQTEYLGFKAYTTESIQL